MNNEPSCCPSKRNDTNVIGRAPITCLVSECALPRSQDPTLPGLPPSHNSWTVDRHILVLIDWTTVSCYDTIYHVTQIYVLFHRIFYRIGVCTLPEHHSASCTSTPQCFLYLSTTVLPVPQHHSASCTSAPQCFMYLTTTVPPVPQHHSVSCTSAPQCLLYLSTTVPPVPQHHSASCTSPPQCLLYLSTTVLHVPHHHSTSCTSVPLHLSMFYWIHSTS